MSINKGQVDELVSRAVMAHGIRHIDTAPWYGCGRSEVEVGDALRSLAATRRFTQEAPARVTTKVGWLIRNRFECSEADPNVVWENGFAKTPENDNLVCLRDFTYEGIMESFRQSAARLGPHCPRLCGESPPLRL